MIYIVTAMHCEAKPFIKRYNLKRDNTCRYFQIYRDNGVTLAVSGIGKMKSAIATAYLLSQCDLQKGTVIFNIGLCGSRNRNYIIGTPVLIHQIIDGETGRHYYPDVLFNHRLSEGSIETHNKVVVREKKLRDDSIIQADFVDMESSGFYQAASQFLAPHQIYVVKVVSDYLNLLQFAKSAALNCMEQAAGRITEFIELAVCYCGKGEEILTEDDREKLNKLKEHLRLTVTQTHELRKMARCYKICTGRELPGFEDIMKMKVTAKHERRRAFDRLRKLLAVE